CHSHFATFINFATIKHQNFVNRHCEFAFFGFFCSLLCKLAQTRCTVPIPQTANVCHCYLNAIAFFDFSVKYTTFCASYYVLLLCHFLILLIFYSSSIYTLVFCSYQYLKLLNTSSNIFFILKISLNLFIV